MIQSRPRPAPDAPPRVGRATPERRQREQQVHDEVPQHQAEQRKREDLDAHAAVGDGQGQPAKETEDHDDERRLHRARFERNRARDDRMSIDQPRVQRLGAAFDHAPRVRIPTATLRGVRGRMSPQGFARRRLALGQRQHDAVGVVVLDRLHEQDGPEGVRFHADRWAPCMTLLTAAIGAFEALLFAMLGRILDWLPPTPPAELWHAHGARCCWLLAACSPAASLLVALQTMLKHQTLAGNFPMRLRWNFHRLMLGQSMGFYQDEFAGRIATKVMQTALAVRDCWMIVTDILVYVVSTSSPWWRARWLRRLDARALRAGWRCTWRAALLRAAPGRRWRKDAGRRALADDRPHHRRLHQHRHRQAVLARAARGGLCARGDAGVPADRAPQMRLVSGFEVVNHTLSVLLVGSTAGTRAVAVDRRARSGRRGGGGHRDGAAPERHLALDDVGDGFAVRAHRHRAGRHAHAVAPTHVSTARARCRSGVTRGEIRFEQVTFAYGGKRRSSTTWTLHIRAGREDRPGRPLGRGQEHGRQPAAALLRPRAGRILIDGQDIAASRRTAARADRHGHAGHLAAAPLGARQHRLRPARRQRRSR
jgi:hypothetical protein